MKPHKHAKLIYLWADGETIQYKDCNGQWKDIKTQPSWDPLHEYRVKPNTVTRYIKYRRFITKACFKDTPGVYCLQYDMRNSYDPQQEASFIRWIDDDWVTATFEEDIDS